LISFIIPVGGDDDKGTRYKYLSMVLRCLKEQTYTDYESIIVEQTFDNKRLFNDFDVTTYASIESPVNRYFNEAWVQNVGAKLSTGELLVFTSADMLFREDNLANIALFYKNMYAHPVSLIFQGWDRYYRLNERGLDKLEKTWDIDAVVQDILGVYHLGEEETPTKRRKIISNDNSTISIASPWGAAHGILCMDRSFFFDEFKGFNERFFGWGYSDTDAAIRILELTQGHYPNIPGFMYHLPHPPYLKAETGNRNNMIARFTTYNRTQSQKELGNMVMGNYKYPSQIKYPSEQLIYIYNMNEDKLLTNLLDLFMPIEYHSKEIDIEHLLKHKPDIIISSGYSESSMQSIQSYKFINPVVKTYLIDSNVSITQDGKFDTIIDTSYKQIIHRFTKSKYIHIPLSPSHMISASEKRFIYGSNGEINRASFKMEEWIDVTNIYPDIFNLYLMLRDIIGTNAPGFPLSNPIEFNRKIIDEWKPLALSY